MIFFLRNAQVLRRDSFDTRRGGAAPPRSTSKRWTDGMENERAGTENTGASAYLHISIGAKKITKKQRRKQKTPS
jgi:hypothetical protein